MINVHYSTEDDTLYVDSLPKIHGTRTVTLSQDVTLTITDNGRVCSVELRNVRAPTRAIPLMTGHAPPAPYRGSRRLRSVVVC